MQIMLIFEPYLVLLFNILFSKVVDSFHEYYSYDAVFPLFPADSDDLKLLAWELAAADSSLSSAFHPDTREAIRQVIVPMNTYYSNFIEDRKTHPIDLIKAVNADYALEPDKRELQLEAQAHLKVNEQLRSIVDPETVTSPDFIKWLHHSFYEELPPEYRVAYSMEGAKIPIAPGHFREVPVKIANHIGPKATIVKTMLDSFHSFYAPGKVETPEKRVITAAASHHRLLWIHPFPDGNGRVTRLFSEAYLYAIGLNAAGMWSISRGLGRNRSEYFVRLSNADKPRLNNYDGRGNLTEKGLGEFASFFLKVCLDQVKYMKHLLQIDGLLGRVEKMVHRLDVTGHLKPEAFWVLKEIILAGSIKRGEAERLTGKSEKTARAIVKNLLDLELLKIEESNFKSPLRLNIPLFALPYYFPELYPVDVETTLPWPGKE
jgi:Fic family protein